MNKTKKYSIPYWLKKHQCWVGPYDAIVTAVKHYAVEGDHPEIEFTGTALELANVLYNEHIKKATPPGSLFCTPAHISLAMASSLDLKPGQVVLDPGLGLGSLSLAVREVSPDTTVIGVEIQHWVAQIAAAAGLRFIHGDFLNGIKDLLSLKIDAVIVNPPFGNVWGQPAVEREFMAKIVEHTQPGTKIAALLPGKEGYFFQHLPKKHQHLRRELAILDLEELPADTFAPAARIVTTRYLLGRE